MSKHSGTDEIIPLPTSDHGNGTSADAQDQDRRFEGIDEAVDQLLHEPNLLKRALEATDRLGHVGEEVNRQLVFLSGVSGLTASSHRDAIHLIIKGESASGKNELVKRSLALFPSDMVAIVTGLSEQALAYLEHDEVSGVLVIQEADGQKQAEYMIRQAMSEGSIRRMTVKGGQTVGVETYVKGSIITTTTSPDVHPENETRLFVLETDDSRQLTAEVVNRVAAEAAGEVSGASNVKRLLAVWRKAMGRLQPAQVIIPFAPELASEFPADSVRARRDIKRVVNLIRACAVLHQRNRSYDPRGRLVASLDDYEMVYPLIQATLPSSMTGLTEKAVQIDELIRELLRREMGSMVSRQRLVEVADRRGIASHNTVDKWAKRFADRAIWDDDYQGKQLFYAPRRSIKRSPVPIPTPSDLRTSHGPSDGVGRGNTGATGDTGDDPNRPMESKPASPTETSNGDCSASERDDSSRGWDDWDEGDDPHDSTEHFSQSDVWDGAGKRPPEWKCLDCERGVPPGREQCATCAFGITPNRL